MMLVSNVIFLLVIFPYVSPWRTPFDTQPWALIVAALFALTQIPTKSGLSLPRPLWMLLLITFYAVLVYLGNSDPGFGLRSLAGYFSVFLLALTGYKTYRYISVKPYVTSVAIWLLVGIIQFMYDTRFAEWIIPRLSTGGLRGVTSLAPEPSLYAIVCVFLLIFNEMFYSERRYGTGLYFAIMLALTLQIVITYSVTGILFMFVFAAAKLLTVGLLRQSVKRLGAALLIGLLLLATLGVVLQVDAFQKTRAGIIAQRAVSDPIRLLYRDESIADRGTHIILSFYSLVYSRGLGLGVGTWNDNAHDLASSAGGWVQELSEVGLSTNGRIMSGWGTAIYEMGVVGVLFTLIALYILAFSAYRNQRMKSICALSMMVVVALLTMSVPLAFPLFGYLLGVHLHYGYADHKYRASSRPALL